jgi:hypothetical protein
MPLKSGQLILAGGHQSQAIKHLVLPSLRRPMKTQRESSCKKIYTVRYDAVNAMLLNEFLKEHNTVQELKKDVAALTAGLQKVSAQLEVSKPAPQTVLNDQ